MFANIFLETMRAHLLQGRFFAARDTHTLRKVALINQSPATRFWSHQNSVGKHIQVMNNEWKQIVWVVADMRATGAAKPVGLRVYLCTMQFDGGGIFSILDCVAPHCLSLSRCTSGTTP